MQIPKHTVQGVDANGNAVYREVVSAVGLDGSAISAGGGGGAALGIANTLWVDNTGASPVYYIRREVDNNGTFTITWENKDGTVATPTLANLTLAQTQIASSTTITQTVVSLAANTATQLVAANSNRKYLAIQVIGTSGVSLNFNAAPTVGNGWAIAGAASNGGQGGAVTWDGGIVSQQQVQAISSAATTVVVLEGI